MQCYSIDYYLFGIDQLSMHRMYAYHIYIYISVTPVLGIQLQFIHVIISIWIPKYLVRHVLRNKEFAVLFACIFLGKPSQMVCLQLSHVVRTKLLLEQEKFVMIDYFHLLIDNGQGEIDYCTIICQIGSQEIGIGSMHRIIVPALLDTWVNSHWGRVTHICLNEITFIGSDNGLSPGGRQAIILTNVGMLLIGPLGTNFSQLLIEIHIFLFKRMHLKMLSGK